MRGTRTYKVRNPSKTVSTVPAWNKLGDQLHRRAVRLWMQRHKHPAKVAMALAELRRLEVYKDIGDETWDAYLSRWGPRRKLVHQFALASPAWEKWPDVMAALYPGALSLYRLTLFLPLVESREDFVWWARLARFTHQKEFLRIIDAYRQALRAGRSGYASSLIVLGVLSEDYQKLVKPAKKLAQEELGREVDQSRLFLWACAKALGVPFPSTMGVDDCALRPVGSAGPSAVEDPALYFGEPRKLWDRPRLEGGLPDRDTPELSQERGSSVDEDGAEDSADTEADVCR